MLTIRSKRDLLGIGNYAFSIRVWLIKKTYLLLSNIGCIGCLPTILVIFNELKKALGIAASFFSLLSSQSAFSDKGQCSIFFSYLGLYDMGEVVGMDGNNRNNQVVAIVLEINGCVGLGLA